MFCGKLRREKNVSFFGLEMENALHFYGATGFFRLKWGCCGPHLREARYLMSIGSRSKDPTFIIHRIWDLETHVPQKPDGAIPH
jgi:hypothetical protein